MLNCFRVLLKRKAKTLAKHVEFNSNAVSSECFTSFRKIPVIWSCILFTMYPNRNTGKYCSRTQQIVGNNEYHIKFDSTHFSITYTRKIREYKGI